MILRGVSQRSAFVMAERVRVAIEGQRTEWKDTLIGATVSVGVVHAPSVKAFEDPAKFIAAADAALYEAKHQGRNCVVMA